MRRLKGQIQAPGLLPEIFDIETDGKNLIVHFWAIKEAFLLIDASIAEQWEMTDFRCYSPTQLREIVESGKTVFRFEAIFKARE